MKTIKRLIIFLECLICGHEWRNLGPWGEKCFFCGKEKK